GPRGLGLRETRPHGPRRTRQGPRGPRTASVVRLSPRAGPALLSGSLADPAGCVPLRGARREGTCVLQRSEEHTSELQSRFDLVCRLLLEKKKIINNIKNLRY